MIRVKRTGNFTTMLRLLALEDHDVVEVIDTAIELFQNKPSDTRLNNHPLQKRLKGRWAFHVTDDIRIVYKWTGKQSIRLLAIGTHEDVYAR